MTPSSVLLRAHDPARFGERKVIEINWTTGTVTSTELSTESIKGIIEILERRQAIESAQRAIVEPVVEENPNFWQADAVERFFPLGRY